jgi:hypothetical protein
MHQKEPQDKGLTCGVFDVLPEFEVCSYTSIIYGLLQAGPDPQAPGQQEDPWRTLVYLMSLLSQSH